MSAHDISGSNNFSQNKALEYRYLQSAPIRVHQAFDKTGGTICDEVPRPKYFPQFPPQLKNKAATPVKNSPKNMWNGNLKQLYICISKAFRWCNLQ